MADNQETVPVTAETLQQLFDVFTNHVRAAADTLTTLIGPQVTLPAAAKGRYLAIDKLQEAHMWAGNGVQALAQAVAANQPVNPNPQLTLVQGGQAPEAT